MPSTQASTEKLPGESFLLPTDEWPVVSDWPMNISYPEIEEDTVELDMMRF